MLYVMVCCVCVGWYDVCNVMMRVGMLVSIALYVVCGVCCVVMYGVC